MRIVLNGKEESVHEGLTLKDLLNQRQLDPLAKGIAVAVNAEVMSREAWPTVVLSSGDRIEIIHAVQGG